MTDDLRATENVAVWKANGALVVTRRLLWDMVALGLLLQSIVERLRGVVVDLLLAWVNISSGSQELSASSEQLSEGATKQAASAAETVASTAEMAASSSKARTTLPTRKRMFSSQPGCRSLRRSGRPRGRHYAHC